MSHSVIAAQGLRSHQFSAAKWPSVTSNIRSATTSQETPPRMGALLKTKTFLCHMFDYYPEMLQISEMRLQKVLARSERGVQNYNTKTDPLFFNPGSEGLSHGMDDIPSYSSPDL